MANDYIETIVTVDADGQHLAGDVRTVCDMARANPRALVLGARALDENVLVKSA